MSLTATLRMRSTGKRAPVKQTSPSKKATTKKEESSDDEDSSEDEKPAAQKGKGGQWQGC